MARKKILIVEPSKLFQQLLEQMLAIQGLTAIFCNTAKEAQQLAKKHEFSLVIIAMHLTQTNGIELAQQLRFVLKPSAVILLLVSTSNKQLIKQAIKSGVTEVIERQHLEELNIYLDSIVKLKQQEENKTIHILNVEDSIPMAQLTKKFLTDSGFTVSTVRSAEESIPMIISDNIDVLICDILLDGKMNGIALIRYIRQLDEPYNQIPILAVSGLNNSDQRIEALRQGANDFLAKPINLTELEIRVRNVVRSHRLFKALLDKEAKLQQLAITDPLTKLYNRHYLHDIGFKALSEAKRHQHAISLIIIDIDHFKAINDNYGHELGDSILKQVGQLLRTSCRHEDFAIRFGGEEFLLVMPFSSPDDAIKKAEQIRLQINELQPENINISASFGVAGYQAEQATHADFKALFQAADDAVYQAKQSGRNRVCHTRPSFE